MTNKPEASLPLKGSGWPSEAKLLHVIGERIADEVEKVAHGRQSNCEQAAKDILTLVPPPPESGWRDIDSAPRTPKGEAAVAIILGFAADEEGFSPTSREGFWNPYMDCWTSTLDPKWKGPQPTHWQPLPPPPEPKGPGE